MDKVKTCILVTVFCFSFLSLGYSETIVLKSGQKVEGRIIEQTDKYVKLDFYGVELVYYHDEIASVEQGASSAEDVNPQLEALYKAYTSSLKVSQKPIPPEPQKMVESALQSVQSTQGGQAAGRSGNPEGVSAGVDLAQLPLEYQKMIKSAIAKRQVSSPQSAKK